MIDIDNLSKTFDPRGSDVLSEISFRVDAGACVSIVGPSGCGKTTLLRIIAGLETSTSGTVTWERSANLGGNSHRRIGFVFQRPILFPWRTVRQNVLLPMETGQGVQERAKTEVAEMRERAADLLANLRLGGYEDAYPKDLSGGMQQRVALARALLIAPDLLLMDEPFSALDDELREQIWEDLLHVRRLWGVTVMLVTHNLREAVFLGDKVIVISGRPGRVIRELPINLPEGRSTEFLWDPLLVRFCRDIRSSFSA